MPDFNELVRQIQQTPQNTVNALWPYWVLLYLSWAATTAISVYICIHIAAVIKAFKGFIDAKSEQIRTSSTSTNPFSRSPEIRKDDDLKYRPRM